MVRIPEQSPDIIFSTREADMRPRVRDYARKVHTELMGLYCDLGVANIEELVDRVAKDPRAFTTVENHRKFLRVQELSLMLRSILTNPKEYALPDEREFRDKEAELRELFGKEYVIGFDAVEKAFTLKDGSHALTISEEERQEAMEQLLDKLAEPDVAAFLDALRFDSAEAKKWMLVYRTSAKVHGTDPVSVLSINDVLDADARSGPQPTTLIYRDEGDDGGWFRNDKKPGESDAWAARALQSGWMFVTRTVVDGTTDKEHSDQTLVLRKKAQTLGFNADGCRRRTPVEVLYDVIVIYKANGICLLEDVHDWTEQENSSSGLISVGGLPGYGWDMFGGAPDVSDDWRGACLSR